MEALSASAVAALATKYLVPAVRNLGARILDAAGSRTGDAVTDFGQRIMKVLLGSHGEKTASPGAASLRKVVERRVAAVSQDPVQQKLIVQLEGAIEDLLIAVPTLLDSMTTLLNRAPQGAERQGARSSYIVGDNSGIVVTGDSNTTIGGARP